MSARTLQIACRVAPLTASILVQGCQGTQLSITTLDIASIIEATQMRQTISNFSRTVKRPYTMPSQVLLSSGTVQVVNTINPGVSFPFTGMFSRTVGTTSTTTSSIAGSGATLGGSVAWQENFIIQPLTDPFTLRNLNILYRVALNVREERSSIFDFQIPRVYNAANKLVPDPYYLYFSNCVFCIKLEGVAAPQSNAQLRKLVESESGDVTLNDVFTYQWLYYRLSGDPAGTYRPRPSFPTTMTPIGSDSGVTFFVADQIPRSGNVPLHGQKLFLDFVLLTLPTTYVPTRLPAPTPTKPAEVNTPRTGSRSRLRPEAPDTGRLGSSSEAFRPNFFLAPPPGIQP